MTPLDLEPSLAPDLGSESEGMSENRTNETIVPKSVFTPNEQSLGYLRSAPDTAADFDAKFGHGLAARYLSEPVVTNSEPEPVQIDTGHILRTMNGEPDVPGELLGQVDARNALSASKRDLAIIESLNRSKDRPVDWDIAPAIAAADANIATWQRWQTSNQDPKLADGYKQGLELARARRQTVLDAEARQPGWLPKQVKDAQASRDKADKKFSDELKSGILSNSTQAETLLAKERYLEVRRIEDDAKAGIERRMGPRDRIKAAETLAAANSAVVNAEDALEAAQADPNLAQTGRTVAFYEDQLKAAKTRQFEMQRFYEYGTAIKDPGEKATFVGDFWNSTVQSASGTFLALTGKGLEHYADETGSEGLRGVGEAFGYIGNDFAHNNTAAYEGPQFSDLASPSFWSKPGAKRQAARWLAFGAGQVAGTAGPIFAGYAAGGLIGAGSIGLTMGVGEAKNILEDALAEQGVAYDPEKHKHFVRAYGLAIGALDTAAAGFLIGKATGDIKQQATKHVAKVYAKNIAKGLAAEGLTEGMQEALGMTLEWHAADKKIDPKEFAKRVVDAFGIGALGGGAVASAHIPTRLREEKDLGRVLEEMTPEERKTFSEGVSNDIVKELQEEAKAQAEKSGTGREAVEAEAVVPIPETAKAPEPVKVDPGQDAISFIRERGGIRDDGGDLASMGAPKSIIRKDGMSADDMREALVEAGYLTELGDYTGTEAQTTENDVFELVARSLAGEKVFVQGSDAAAELAAYDKNRSTLETEEASAIIRDLQREMETNEIPYNLTDAEEVRIVELVRDKMMDPFDAMEKLAVDRYNKGGLRSGGKGGASASSAPFPSVGPRGAASSGARTPLGDGTPRRVSGGSVRKLADYLREGGSLSSKAKSQIAERAGIAETDVPELLARAESEGVLKKDRRGRYRRGAAFETYRGVDGADLNLQAAQTAAEQNAENDRNAYNTVRQMKTFKVAEADVQATLSALAPAMHMVPEGTHVVVMDSIVPLEPMEYDGKPDMAVAVHGQTPDGDAVSTILPLSYVSKVRALFLPDGYLVGTGGPSVFFLSTSRLGETDRLYSGGLRHELVHLYMGVSLLEGGKFDALLAAAHRLRILDMELGTVLQVVGDPSAGFARGGITLHDEYSKLYADRENKQHLIDQEAVAYLIELNHHGYWTPDDLTAVQDIIAQFEAGAFAGRGNSSGGGIMAALTGRSSESPLFAISGRQMPGGQSRVPSPGLDAPAKSISDLVKDLNTALGLTTRQGRLNPGLKAMAGKRGGKLQGQHNSATGVTRLALPEDIETLAHEGGHALEMRFGTDLRSLMQQYAVELEPLASPGSDALSEGFAEYFRRYVTNPSAAENVAPDFTNEFDEFLDRMEPGLRDALEGIQAGYQAWIDAPSGGAVAASVQSAKDPGLIKRFTEKYRTRGFRDAAKEDADKVYTGVFDELHPIKRAVDMLIRAAEKNLRVQLGRAQSIGVTAANDAYKLLRLARNAYQGGHMALMRGVRSYHGSAFSGPSYRDALGHAFGGFEAAHWSDANQKAFNAYLVSRRMVREWDRFKAGEITNPPDKLSRADHEQSLKDYEAAHPRFRKAAEMLSGYQKNLLTLAHDAGFLSDEAYQTYVSRSDYYVPLQRVMEDEKAPGKAFSDTNDRSPIKRFKGSTRDIVNPTESIAKFTYELHYMIARNDAIRALDVLARAVGPGGGAIAERIPATQMQGTNVDAIEVVKAAAAKQGLDELDVLPMIAAIEEALGEDTTGTVFRAGQINEKGEPIVYLWEGGKRVPIRLADGDFGLEMFQSITGLGKEWTGLFVNGLSIPTQALRAGITLDPAFIGANFLRDQLSAWILTEDFTPFVSGLKGSVTAARGMFGGETPDLDLANAAGIIMGGAGVAGIHESRVKRDVEKLRHKGIRVRDVQPFNRKFWELTGLTETGTRLAVFRNARLRALRDGLSEHEAIVEAAYTANDLIDFGRHGSKMLTARRMVTFLNASLQGLEKAFRVGTGQSNNPRVIRDIISPYIKSRTGQPLSILEQKQVPVSAKAYAKFFSLGLVGFALALAYRDDEEYQEIPAYFRNTHWMFKATDGSWIRIPKPWELAAFSNIVERSFERAYHDDEKAMDRLVSGLFELVTPPHTVPGVQVAYELWANKSTFSGMPIVPDRLQGLDPEMQFTEYTSEFSKKLAQWTGISAAKLDHAIMGLGGGLGRTGLALTDQAFNLTGYANRPEMRMEEAPFVRRFTTDPVRSSQSKQEFWKQMGQTDGELSRVATSYKELWDRGQYLEASNLLEKRSENQKVYALLEGHGRAADKRLHPMNRAKDILSVTSGIRRELGSGELTKPDRTEYGPSDLRVITEMIEAIQMREARNAMIVTGQPGFKHMTLLDVQPVMAELRAKAPDLADELEYRLADKKIQDFEDVRAGWPELKATVLAPGYAEDHPSRREAGRRSGYDTEMPAP